MRTVLIIDDEPELRFLLRSFLENEGFDCLEVGNGEKALQVLREHGAVDLVLTDFHMPGMNGVELLRMMRLHPMHCQIPSILITAEYSTAILTHAMQAGAKHVLFKPYNFVTLRNCITTLLRPTQAALAICVPYQRNAVTSEAL